MSAAPKPRRATLLSLQYCRGLAALAVLLSHAVHGRWFAVGLASGLGVALFFVLSGFLMVFVTDASTRPLAFMRARVMRVIPLYWILTIAVVFIQWSHVSRHSPIPFRYLLHEAGDAPWLHILKSLTFIPSTYDSSNGIFPILPMGWTLNLEMMFYALFALLLILPRAAQVPALSVVLVALTAAGLIWRPESTVLIIWTAPIILYFVAGAWLGWVWSIGGSLWRPVVALTVAWVPFAVLIIGQPSHRPVNPGLIFLAPLVILIFVGALVLERRPEKISDWWPLRVLGEASYSVYLWQFIPILLLDMLRWRPLLASWQYGIIVLVSGLVGGWAVHVMIELPLSRMTKRPQWAKPAPHVVG